MIDLTARYNGDGYTWRPLSAVTHACIHHMGTLGFVPRNDAPIPQIDSISAYHRNHHGWPSIGYHIVVTDREWYLVTSLARTSWHVAYNNHYTVGILVLADYSNGGRPSAGHIKQIRAALAFVTKAVGRKLVVMGHKEFPQNATSCPGPLWYSWKPELTYREPAPPPPVVVEGIDLAQVDFYAKWALERVANGQDPRNFMAFVEHLRGVGKDFLKPYFHGWPSKTQTRNASGLLDLAQVRFYAEWALQRVANKEDPRDKAAFTNHLRAVGKWWTNPWLYGWPVYD